MHKTVHCFVRMQTPSTGEQFVISNIMRNARFAISKIMSHTFIITFQDFFQRHETQPYLWRDRNFE